MTALTPQQTSDILEGLTALAIAAGQAIRQIARDALDARIKADLSPVTAADHRSEAVLLDGVRSLMPGIPIISEEAFNRDAPRKAVAATFVLIDPLDGTREFIAGGDDYAINIAVISAGTPVAGVIGAPAQATVWRGGAGRAERLHYDAQGRIVEQSDIRTRSAVSPPHALVSRSHGDPATDGLLTALGATRQPYGSALKFCLLAQGDADLYLRLGPTSEWDIAAGEAVVTAAGGRMTAPDGRPLHYGRVENGFRVPGFLAWGDAARPI